MTKSKLDDLRVKTEAAKKFIGNRSYSEAVSYDITDPLDAFQATANPDTVLSLLEEIAELRWRLEGLEK